MTATYKQSRYQGTQSFARNQRHIFFGRDNDIDKLSEMIEMERMVLVYAKSGIGKTSLINAGVCPKLESTQQYSIHEIRFGAYIQGSIDPLTLAQRKFAKLHTGQNYLDKILPADNSLWYYTKLWQLQQTDKNQKLLLIFDQFEELFTYPDEQVDVFKKQLAELLFSAVPQRFIDQKDFLDDLKPGFLNQSEEKLLFEQPNVKILFAIRSDRMSWLNRMSDYIPRILMKYYELSPLTKEQALDAILKPAKMNGDFVSNKFDFQESAIDAIFRFLTKDYTQANNIESFQLQILCQVVERLVVQRKIYLINANDIEPVREIYLNFYIDLMMQLNLNDAQRINAKILVEDGLIEEATQRRLQLAKEQIKLKYEIDDEILNKLVDSRLLRTEDRDNFRVYEISHDTLVAPILEARRERVEKEEELKTEAENLEKLRIANEKAEKERVERDRERKRQRRVIAIVGSVAVVALIALVFAVVLYFQAQEATKEAEKSRKDAEKQLENFIIADKARKKAEIDAFVRNAEQYITFKQFDDAKFELLKALKIDSTNTIVLEKLQNLNK